MTREGFPLGYEVFAGNRTDVTTVEEIVEEMESRYGKASRIWAMDRGMISENNLEWLRQEQRKYIVGTSRSDWKTLSLWQRKARLGSSPKTILEEFHRIQSVDVILPLESGRELRLRCVVQPDKAQKILLQRLGLRLPKRLRSPRTNRRNVVPTWPHPLP